MADHFVWRYRELIIVINASKESRRAQIVFLWFSPAMLNSFSTWAPHRRKFLPRKVVSPSRIFRLVRASSSLHVNSPLVTRTAPSNASFSLIKSVIVKHGALGCSRCLWGNSKKKCWDIFGAKLEHGVFWWEKFECFWFLMFIQQLNCSYLVEITIWDLLFNPLRNKFSNPTDLRVCANKGPNFVRRAIFLEHQEQKERVARKEGTLERQVRNVIIHCTHYLSSYWLTAYS